VIQNNIVEGFKYMLLYHACQSSSRKMEIWLLHWRKAMYEAGKLCCWRDGSEEEIRLSITCFCNSTNPYLSYTDGKRCRRTTKQLCRVADTWSINYLTNRLQLSLVLCLWAMLLTEMLLETLFSTLKILWYDENFTDLNRVTWEVFSIITP